MRKLFTIIGIGLIITWHIYGFRMMCRVILGLIIGTATCIALGFICYYGWKLLDAVYDWLYIKICWIFGYYAVRGKYYWYYTPKSMGKPTKVKRIYTDGY